MAGQRQEQEGKNQALHLYGALWRQNHQAGAHSQSKAGGPLKTNPVLACLGKGTRLWAHDEGVWLGGTQVRLVRDY